MVLCDTKREQELKRAGVTNVWAYGNTDASILRCTPEVKLEGMLVRTHGALIVPSRPAKATLRMHQGYFHAYGYHMEDLTDLGFFCMRLGIEGEGVLSNMFKNTKRKLDEKMQILNDNYQVLNSRIFKGVISHAIDTRYEYSKNLKDIQQSSGLHNLKELSPEDLSALFDIEPVEKAKELLTERFRIFTKDIPASINFGYQNNYQNAFFYRINQKGLVIHALHEDTEAFAACGGSDWYIKRVERLI